LALLISEACYESSEFTKRVIYYPRDQGIFQRLNAELCLSPPKIDHFPQSGFFLEYQEHGTYFRDSFPWSITTCLSSSLFMMMPVLFSS
jgi:hypothetical protein